MLIGRLTRNHRKVLLVDDEVAFVGGINIGDENLGAPGRVGWADLALEIRGPQCAALGHRIRREPHPPVVSAVRIHLSSLGGGWRLRRTYMRAFAGASRRIRIAHGYFLPDAKMIRALVAAARRGVEVRLLLAGHSDVPFARAATRSLYRRLLPAGVRIHEWTDSVLHAKLATIDGRCLLAGSFNLDPLSLANLETLVEVDDPRTVAEGDAWIQRRLATSTIMTSVASGTWVRRWILDPLGRIAARVASATGRLLSTRRARGAVPNPPRAAIEPNADDG
jgi:cardiolipin synthase